MINPKQLILGLVLNALVVITVLIIYDLSIQKDNCANPIIEESESINL